MEPLYTVKEIALMARSSTYLVYQAIKRHELLAKKVGYRWLIGQSAYEAWVRPDGGDRS